MSFDPPYVYDEVYKNGRPSGFNSYSDVWSSGVRYQSIPGDRKIFPGKTLVYGFDKEPTQNHSKYTESSTSKDKQKEPKELVDVFDRFADTTSLQGIPFIKRASRWYAKMLWVLVFLSATGAWIFHSYFLIATYLQFETSSSVAIVFEHAAFPSVTFCNINPMRIDTLSTYGSKQLGTFMTSTKPKEALTPRGPVGPPAGRRKLLAVNPNQQSPDNQPKKNEQSQAYQYSDYVNQQQVSIASGTLNWTYFASLAVDYQDVIEDSKASSSARTLAVFKELMADLPSRNRTQGGHSLSQMMLSCSYDGEHCSAKNFTKSLDINYGNCWTFNSEHLLDQSLKSLRGGANTGLDLVINLHEYQYLKGLNIGRGLRVHLHPFDTMSFVSTSGFSVSPGKQTYVGVRAINQTRLGGIYGPCNDDNGQFVSYYDGAYQYTLDGCINTCLERTIATQCQCYRKTQRQYYRRSDIQNRTHCSSFEELTCVRKYSEQFTGGTLTCGCNQACNTIEYESQVTMDSWPGETLWFSLVDAVCQRDETSCEYFESITPENRETILQKNFIHLQVYFKDLNVQKIDEKAQYETAQFASDFGGAIGLWVGASAITVIEILDLSCQVFTFCRRKKKYKARKEATKNENGEDKLANSSSGVFGTNIKAKLPRSTFEHSGYIPFNNL